MLSRVSLIRTIWFQLMLLTFLGALLRLWGVLHGLQENFLYHWDSQQTLGQAWDFFLGVALSKNSWSGPIYNLFLTYLMSGIENVIRFLGVQVSWSLERMAVAASLMNVILGTATIPVLYLLGERAYHKKAGMIAAAFLSVCPLHSFHSHYPYRDVPMVFFLVFTLYLCVLILEKPSLINLLFGGFFTLITASLKPAGLVVAVPYLTATIMGIVAKKKFWLFFFLGAVIIGSVLFASRLSPRVSSLSYIWAQFSQRNPLSFSVYVEMIKILNQWIGFPILLAMGIALAYGLLRLRQSDIILISFLVSALIALVTAYYIDERFLIFLLPAGMTVLGRALMDFREAFFRKKYITIIPIFIFSGLFAYSLIQSSWQGIMFSIPDTRFLSGKWFDAHLNKETRVYTEAYYPLALNEWPNVFPFDTTHPIKNEAKEDGIFVTSSAEHQRYFDFPYRFPRIDKSVFETLKKQGFLLKIFSLDSLGFIHTTLKVYSFPHSKVPLALDLRNVICPFPRPYDSGWNGGVSFLEKGPIDRDDRTIKLGWGYRYTTTLVSPKTGQEMVAFMLNGSEKSTVKVRVGFTTKIRTLRAGEFHILKFKPKWFFPKKPALYRFEAGLPEGKNILIQLRCGDREIGQSYAKWGEWEKALPYLKRALAADSDDLEVRFLLAINYEKLGKSAEARAMIKEIGKGKPGYFQMLFSLGKSDVPISQWENQFQNYTGLKPSLLRYALSQEFTIDKAFPSPSGAGVLKDDCRATGGKTITYDKTLHKSAEVMHGPYLHLDQGAYLAGFYIRTWDVQGGGPFAEIKILEDDKVISKQSVSIKNLKENDKLFKEVRIPFINEGPRTEIKFQVFATGSASFAVEKIRIEPDLQKTFQEKWITLKTLAGEDLLSKDVKKPSD